MELFEQDLKYILNVYRRMNLSFEKGKGVFLYDKYNTAYLDTFSGLAVNLLGYSHPNLSKIIHQYSEKYLHLSNFYIQNEQIKLAKELIENTSMSKVFFTNSGTESIEAALKVYRKKMYLEKRKKARVLVLQNSFHGRTLGSLSLTIQEKYQKFFIDENESVLAININDVESLKKTEKEDIGAVFIELIQGEGGVLPMDKDFLSSLYALSKQKNALFIVDEIQTGLGRTGKLFCCQHFNIKADMIITAKGLGGGLPLGAVIFNESTSKILSYGDHGSTFGGNPLACALGLATLQTIKNDSLMEKVNENSQFLIENIESSPILMKSIKKIRGRGYMLGLELDFDESIINEIKKEFLNKYILVNFTKGNVLRLLPALIFENEHILHFITIFEKILKKI